MLMVLMLLFGFVLFVGLSLGRVHPAHHLKMPLHLRIGPELVEPRVRMDAGLDRRIGEEPTRRRRIASAGA